MKILELFQLGARYWPAKFGTVALISLAGCGGGGGDAITVIPPPSPPAPTVGELTLLAGATGGVGSTDGTPGRFNQPTGLAIDASGNVYVADTSNHTVRKITATGVVTLAGKPGVTGSADGIGAAALFNTPVAVALDSAGNVYVADSANSTIRKITPAGSVTTFAGAPGASGNADGTGSAARLGVLKGIAIDANGTVFVAEQNQVRKITPAGLVTTLATGFNALSSLAVDSAGNVYVVDSGASVIRKIAASGAVTVFAGSTTTTNGIAPFGFADGGPGVAKFDHPAGIAIHTDGVLYVLDNGRIRRVTPDGVVNSLPILKSDGTRFILPGNSSAGVAIAADGSVFVAAPVDNIIRKVTPTLAVVDVAGRETVSGTADGTGAAAQFSGTGELAIDASGNIIVVDALNNAIRKISPSGVVTTVASNVRDQNATQSGIRSGPAILRGLAIDRSGAVFVADPYFHLIRRIGVDGSRTIAAGANWPDGTSTGGFFPVFLGRSTPIGVAVDSAGNLYVPDGAIIRKVMISGSDTVLACTSSPTCVAAGKPIDAITTDKADNIYAAQAGVIFKITPVGASSVLAGGAATKFTDGVGANASFGSVQALSTDAAGNIFVADTSNNAVRKITPAGVVTTIAGAAGAVGVALGTLPGSLSAPAGVAVDATGMIYVSSENAVLKIKP